MVGRQIKREMRVFATISAQKIRFFVSVIFKSEVYQECTCSFSFPKIDTSRYTPHSQTRLTRFWPFLEKHVKQWSRDGREIEAYLPMHCEAVDKDWMPFRGSLLTETFEENQDAGSL